MQMTAGPFVGDGRIPRKDAIVVSVVSDTWNMQLLGCQVREESANNLSKSKGSDSRKRRSEKFRGDEGSGSANPASLFYSYQST